MSYIKDGDDDRDWFDHEHEIEEEIARKFPHTDGTHTDDDVSTAKEMTAAPKIDGTATDIGNGARFAKQHANSFRFIPTRGAWIRWDGRRWANATSSDLLTAAKEVVEAMFGKALADKNEDRREAGLKWATKSASAARLEAMIKLATASSALQIAQAQLDQHHHLLTVLNGTVDLRSGALLPHAQENYLTKLTPIRYDASAQSPRWLQFLVEVFNKDEEMIRFVQRAVGYSLTGYTSAHAFFVLHGGGRNGKGRFVRQLMALLGDAARTTRFSTFTADQGSQAGANTPELAELVGARVVSAGEPDDGVRLSESVIKSLTGEDEITVCRKYEHPFCYTPTFKLFLHTNHRPEIRGTDTGIWSRPRLIPFLVTFDGKEGRPHPDPDLDAKLDAERSGILAWAVAGARQWFTNGLGSCSTVEKATAAYREESDALAPFFADRITAVPDSFTPSKELYAAYVAWCEQNANEPWKMRSFSIAVKRRGFQDGRGMKNGDQVRGFFDIKVTL